MIQAIAFRSASGQTPNEYGLGAQILGPLFGPGELRVIGLDVRGWERFEPDVPGLGGPTDFNVSCAFRRFGTAESLPSINNVPGSVGVAGGLLDPAGRSDAFSGALYGGIVTAPLGATNFLWQSDFQIRRGLRKRWPWNGAIVIGRNEKLVLLFAPRRAVSYSTVSENFYGFMRGTLLVASSPDDLG